MSKCICKECEAVYKCDVYSTANITPTHCCLCLAEVEASQGCLLPEDTYRNILTRKHQRKTSQTREQKLMDFYIKMIQATFADHTLRSINFKRLLKAAAEALATWEAEAGKILQTKQGDE
jgi:hypothetical protein